jgi:sister chromatid cohesion protein DCC1
LIHGTPEDDAVICTEDKTYAVRTVVLSNTVMVASSSTHEQNTVLVQDEIRGLLEMAPCLPRLHRVHEMLAGLEIGEDSVLDGDVDGEEEGDMNTARNKPRAVSTYHYYHLGFA